MKSPIRLHHFFKNTQTAEEIISDATTPSEFELRSFSAPTSDFHFDAIEKSKDPRTTQKTKQQRTAQKNLVIVSSSSTVRSASSLLKEITNKPNAKGITPDDRHLSVRNRQPIRRANQIVEEDDDDKDNDGTEQVKIIRETEDKMEEQVDSGSGGDTLDERNVIDKNKDVTINDSKEDEKSNDKTEPAEIIHPTEDKMEQQLDSGHEGDTSDEKDEVITINDSRDDEKNKTGKVYKPLYATQTVEDDSTRRVALETVAAILNLANVNPAAGMNILRASGLQLLADWFQRLQPVWDISIRCRVRVYNTCSTVC